MNVGFLSALSALAGSAVGGLTSGVATWLAQRTQSRAGQLAHDLEQREDLYRDFITTAARTYGDALMNTEPQIADLVALYAMNSRMRVLSATRVVTSADQVVASIIDTYFSPNRSVRELRDLIKAGQGIDPLKEFSEAAREELARGLRMGYATQLTSGRSLRQPKMSVPENDLIACPHCDLLQRSAALGRHE